MVKGSPQTLSMRRSPARFMSSGGGKSRHHSVIGTTPDVGDTRKMLQSTFDRANEGNKKRGRGSTIDDRDNKASVSKKVTSSRKARKCVSKINAATQTDKSYIEGTSISLKETVPVRDAIQRTRDLLKREIMRRNRERRDDDESSKKSTVSKEDATGDLDALNESLRWTEAELRAAQEHVLCLGDSVNSWSAMSEGAVDRALGQAATTSLQRGVLMTKLSWRAHPFGGRRFSHRIVRVLRDTDAARSRIEWFSPTTNIDVHELNAEASNVRSRSIDFVDVEEIRFGKMSGVFCELLERVDETSAKSLATRSISVVAKTRSLDLMLGDSQQAIGTFLALQSLVPSRTTTRESWRRTREQLQWECGQIVIENFRRRVSTDVSSSASLAPVAACHDECVDFSRLVPLFNRIQRTMSAQTTRESFRAELRRHKDAVHTLPLPASNERIHRIVSDVQYRKDLIRESGLMVNSVFYPLASSGSNYDVCLRALQDALRGVELVTMPTGASPAKRMKRRRESGDVKHILPEVLRSASRTLTDGDAFSVLHRCFSVPQSVLLTPSGPQIPISIFVSHDAIVTVQSKSSFNAVHLNRRGRGKPQVWATIETTVVENISFDDKGEPSRVRHLVIRL